MRRIKTVILGICIILCLLFGAACGSSGDIYGTWEGQVPITIIGLDEYYDVETKVVFNFDSDGTGSYKMQTPEGLDLPKDDSEPTRFDYEISDDYLILTFSPQETEEYEYDLNEDVLILTGNGKEYDLSRKE